MTIISFYLCLKDGQAILDHARQYGHSREIAKEMVCDASMYSDDQKLLNGDVLIIIRYMSNGDRF